MIGASRVACRRPDPAVLFPEQLFFAELLAFAKAPLFAGTLVQEFGESLREAVRERLGHDGVVIIMIELEMFAEFLNTKPGANGKGPEIIRCGAFGRDVVGQAIVKLIRWLIHLLAEEMEG